MSLHVRMLIEQRSAYGRAQEAGRNLGYEQAKHSDSYIIAIRRSAPVGACQSHLSSEQDSAPAGASEVKVRSVPLG